MFNVYPNHINGWIREDQSSRASSIASQPDFADTKKRIGSYIPSGGSGVASDLRRFSPAKRHNQLTSQSCVTNSMTRALENKRIQTAFNKFIDQGLSDIDALSRAHLAHIPLSRLALYFLCREEMNPPETDKDGGTYISIAAEMLTMFGLAREEKNKSNPSDQAFWSFDLNNIFVSPTWKAMREAYLHRISSWSRINSTGKDRVDDVITSLSSGNTVVFGTTIDNQWMNYSGGIIGPTNGVVRGRHATMLCGWDPSGFFWDENSWDNSWGIDGFCKLTPEVISSYDSEDFIVIEGSV